jgi:hypothetical protein
MASRNSHLLLNPDDKPQKKFKLKVRHHKVAEEFREHMEQHPRMSRKEKYKTFDAFCDSAFWEDVFKKERSG